MIEHRAKTAQWHAATRWHSNTSWYSKNAVLGLTVFGVLLPAMSRPAAGQTSAEEGALTTVPIEIRFDLIDPCIKNRRLDASMGMSADVFVDGHLDRSVTNHNGTGREHLELATGSHEIKVSVTGYPEDTKTIMVRGNSSQKFAFHVRSGSGIAVEVMRTHNPDQAHKWLRKLRRKGQPATVRTVSPAAGHEPELLAVQIGPLPTCDAAEQKLKFIEETYEQAAYIVPLLQ